MSINSVGGNSPTTLPAYLQQTSQTKGVAALTGGSDPDNDGAVRRAGAVKGDSAAISGPGKLFSELQQLQSQDPAKFKAVVSDIASKLQTAAQQSSGPQADFLTKLATKFQTAASSGDVAALKPPAHRHPEGTYNQQGRLAPVSSAPVGNPPPAPVGTTSAGTDLRQLFASISQEVTAAVSA